MSDEDKKEKETTIIVNGQEKTVQGKTVSFSQVTALAFPDKVGDPNVMFTVTYRKSGNEHQPAGTLDEGNDVKVKDGTIFDVTPTTKS